MKHDLDAPFRRGSPDTRPPAGERPQTVPVRLDTAMDVILPPKAEPYR